jgi:uncharacterized protein with NRDE domain
MPVFDPSIVQALLAYIACFYARLSLFAMYVCDMLMYTLFPLLIHHARPSEYSYNMLATCMAFPSSLYVLCNAHCVVSTQAWKRTRRRRALCSLLEHVRMEPDQSVQSLFQKRTKVEKNAGRERAVDGLRGESLLLLELFGGGRGRCCIVSALSHELPGLINTHRRTL